MKIKTILFLMFAMLFVSSCGNTSQTDDKTTHSEEEIPELLDGTNADLKEAGDCDEFIDQYEEWMDNYLEFLEKYMKNPMDTKLATSYMTLAQEGANWMSQWTTKFYYCASDEKFEKRFDEISAKANKKMEELGLN